jgi:ADP-ribosylglycohydrolase
MDLEIVDRFRGAVIGLAVGDCMGVPLEFKAPGTFEPVNEMVGGGCFGLKPGEWTDDTSLALCLAESLAVSGGFDPVDQMKRYSLWYRDGRLSVTGECFDIGNTTRHALHSFERTGEPYSGPSNERSAGNGSIMRLAPVPLFFSFDPYLAVERSGDSSRTTHGNQLAVDACRYMGGIIHGALNGTTKEEILSEFYSPIPGYWDDNPMVNEIAEVASGSFKVKNPPEIMGTGYVVRSLEAALWAFARSSSFEEGCLMAVNLGDDADTTGAVYGQIAGAYYGESGIPRRWVGGLAGFETIKCILEKLLETSESSQACANLC